MNYPGNNVGISYRDIICCSIVKSSFILHCAVSGCVAWCLLAIGRKDILNIFSVSFDRCSASVRQKRQVRFFVGKAFFFISMPHVNDFLSFCNQGKNIIVFYGSQTGTAEEFANRLSKDAQRYGMKGMAADPEEYEMVNCISGTTSNPNKYNWLNTLLILVDYTRYSCQWTI